MMFDGKRGTFQKTYCIREALKDKKRKTARVSKPNHAKPVVKLVYRSFVTQMKEQHRPHTAQEPHSAIGLNSLVIKINNSNNYNPSHF